jgi:hypothetical protein
MADTLRIRMMTMAAGPAYQAQAGEEVDLPRGEAEGLISAGYAELVVAEAQGEIHAHSEAELDAALGERRDPEAGTWTATTAEAAAEESASEPAAGAPPETATAGPQRSGDADDQLAAEQTGRDAAAAKEPRTANPYDGRSSLGRAWFRGWDSVQ